MIPGPLGGTHPSRSGLALPLVLCLLLALTLLGHGTLLLSLRELSASKAFLHSVRADLAAEGAISRAFLEVPNLPDSRTAGTPIPLSSGWASPDLWTGASLRWLGPELFLMEGMGRSRGWPGIRVKWALGWALDPATRVGAFTAGLEVGGGLNLGPGVEISGSEPLGSPTDWGPEACSGYDAALDSAFSGRTLPPWSRIPSLDPGPGEVGSNIPPLGLLSGQKMMDLAREEGLLVAGRIPPSTLSGCPGSKGPGFLGSESDLDIVGLAACGLLVVAGDVRIGGEGSFQGLALVGGNLSVDSSGRFEGLARVRGTVHLEESAKIRILACPAFRALMQTPSLLKPLVLPGASRIPAF